MLRECGKSVKSCLYTQGYCKHWKACAIEYLVDYFSSPNLKGLFQHHRDEILAEREVNKAAEEKERERKLMRKKTRRYTFRARRST